MTVQPTNATYLDGNRGRLRLPGWRWDALRTTLWVVPVLLIVVACLLFVSTFEIDLAAFHHRLTLPTWVRTGSADAGRQVLIAIAAAIITTVGVVFSITIFGPHPCFATVRTANDAQFQALLTDPWVPRPPPDASNASPHLGF